MVASNQGLGYSKVTNTLVLQAALDPRDNAIYAVCDGTLIVTTEKIAPNMAHDVAEKFYSTLKGPMFKRFINIVPKKEPIVFRLIDLV